MAWIGVHQNLKDHPKVIDLMNLASWDLDKTLAKLLRFWLWCVDYAEDGDLRKHNDARLAVAVGLDAQEGKRFVDCMVQSGWIDREPYFRVHDWWEYFGLFLQRKYGDKNRHKWEAVQQLYKNCTVIDATQPNQQNTTKPNQHNKTKQNLDALIQQNEVLLSQYDAVKKERIETYLQRIAMKNKSKSISPGRMSTLLLELANSRSRCNNDAVFMQGVEASIDRDACCIGYVNAVIKNKKIQKPR